MDSIIASGILMVQEGDNEKTIRSALTKSLTGKVPLHGTNDFEFVKVRHKAITMLE